MVMHRLSSEKCLSMTVLIEVMHIDVLDIMLVQLNLLTLHGQVCIKRSIYYRNLHLEVHFCDMSV